MERTHISTAPACRTDVGVFAHNGRSALKRQKPVFILQQDNTATRNLQCHFTGFWIVEWQRRIFLLTVKQTECNERLKDVLHLQVDGVLGYHSILNG